MPIWGRYQEGEVNNGDGEQRVRAVEDDANARLPFAFRGKREAGECRNLIFAKGRDPTPLCLHPFRSPSLVVLEKSIGTPGRSWFQHIPANHLLYPRTPEVNREALANLHSPPFTTPSVRSQILLAKSDFERQLAKPKLEMGATRVQKEAYFVKLKELIAKHREPSLRMKTHTTLTQTCSVNLPRQC